jgi:hypothetical protein
LHAWLGLCTTVVISEAARRQRSLSHCTLTRTHARTPSPFLSACELWHWHGGGGSTGPRLCARMMEGADLSGRAFSETCAKRFGPAAGIFHCTRFPCMSPVASYLTSECLRLAIYSNAWLRRLCSMPMLVLVARLPAASNESLLCGSRSALRTSPTAIAEQAVRR